MIEVLKNDIEEEKLIRNKKIEELTKNEMLLATRLIIAEKLINSFKDENDLLKNENQKLQSVLNKKAVKNKEDF
jgi:hypothetical protein